MKKLIPILLLIMLIVGCGKNDEQTSATQVKNPLETAPPAATVPAPMPPKPAPAVKAVDKSGWITLEGGLKYKDKKVGKGTEATSNSRVTVQYKGWLDNGTVFDSSRKPGREPFSFTIDEGNVIKGWDQGLKGMEVGGIRELNIPPTLGYGDQDQGAIPPNSTLHFEIELLEVAK